MNSTTQSAGSGRRVPVIAAVAVVLAALGIDFAIQPEAGALSQAQLETVQPLRPAPGDAWPEPDESAELDGTVHIYY
jgi:hypothetical protein